MERPTLRQLEYVLAVADTGTFHGAADVAHATQPTVSAQVRALERRLGVVLFERGARGAQLTAAGEAFVHGARDALLAVDEAIQAATRAGAPFTGALALGSIPTVAPYLLPRALAVVRKRWPGWKVHLTEARTAVLLDDLRAGRLDVVLLAQGEDLAGLTAVEVRQDPFVLAVPEGHRLARRRSVSPAELEGEPLLLLEDGHCLRDQALAVCNWAPRHAVVDVRAGSLTTIVQMVAGGLGVTLLPAMALEAEIADDLGLCVVPFTRPKPARTIVLAHRPRSARRAEWNALAEVIRALA
jgi:LysR family hydrogen peroxide-inducible transcriptional activator